MTVKWENRTKMEFSREDHPQTDIAQSQAALPARPVPRPFSIEALMSDCGPKKTHQVVPVLPWNLSPTHNEQYQNSRDFNSRDTDSDNSLDMELAQDLSRRSRKDGKRALYKKFLFCNIFCKMFCYLQMTPSFCGI